MITIKQINSFQHSIPNNNIKIHTNTYTETQHQNSVQHDYGQREIKILLCHPLNISSGRNLLIMPLTHQINQTKILT